MSDHPGEGRVRPKPGVTDDNFSPVWADDDRPRIPAWKPRERQP